MKLRHFNFFSIAFLLVIGLMTSGSAFAQEPLPVVDSANPSSAVQGTYDLSVEIAGSNFGRGAVVRFFPNCDHEPDSEPKPAYCRLPAEGINVGTAKAKGTTKLVVTVSVLDESYVGPIDIEVELYGRKGKGTTLFNVQAKESSQPSDCMLDFDATFYDISDGGTWLDGVRSDNIYQEDKSLDVDMGPYYAFGGTGLRMDTNGSMKLERSNDTRFITVDFSRAADCDEDSPGNPAVAAGFCEAQKGSDMRFEHQVQVLTDNGLCLQELGDLKSMRVSMGFLFLQSPGGTLGNEFKNGKQNGDGSTALKLNYGCQGQNLLQTDLRIGQDGKPDYRAKVTRHDKYTWTIKGEWACLHTQLGHKLEDANGTVYLRMPFGLTIVDLNAPPNN